MFARAEIAQKTGKNLFNKTEKQIARELGYSEQVARNTPQIKATKAYQDEKFNVLEAYENERKRLIEAIQTKSLKGVKYNQGVEALKTLTHDIQLIGGNATERVGGKASEELAGLIGDIRGVITENKMKQAAIVQTNPQDSHKPLEIEQGEAKPSETVSEHGK